MSMISTMISVKSSSLLILPNGGRWRQSASQSAIFKIGEKNWRRGLDLDDNTDIMAVDS